MKAVEQTALPVQDELLLIRKRFHRIAARTEFNNNSSAGYWGLIIRLTILLSFEKRLV
jgi:hypothetical protein